MRIKIEPYSNLWPKQFQQLKTEIGKLLVDFNPKIEHFGSTSIPGLAAKPVIDILVGLQTSDQLDQTIPLILKNDKYFYYQAFNQFMPNRRLFVRLKDDVPSPTFENTFTKLESIPHEIINRLRLAHIHIWQVETEDWLRHIAFREYLKSHPQLKAEYGKIKAALSIRDWKNGMEYNDGKNEFIKGVEKKAIIWYRKTKK